MKAVLYFKLVRFFWMIAMITLVGCVTSPLFGSTPPFQIVMKSPSQLVVNDKLMDSTQLVRALKRSRVPTSEPLVIEMSTSMPLDAIKILTQKLASAGYKPVFKGARHADASASMQGKLPDPSRIKRP